MARIPAAALIITALVSSRAWAQTACGNNLIGAGPPLSDAQAAAMVRPAPDSSTDAANAAANNYYPTHQAGYAQELAAWRAGAPSWGGVTAHIDGACPLNHPNTAEIIQWAADKWHINPALMYAEAVVEHGWMQGGTRGDSGGSVGLFQVADRVANRPGGSTHFFPGLENSNLAWENSCFNADFYAGRLYAVFNGLAGATTPAGNLIDAVQAWFQHNAMGPGPYSNDVCTALADQSWRRFFGGQTVVLPANTPAGDPSQQVGNQLTQNTARSPSPLTNLGTNVTVIAGNFPTQPRLFNPLGGAQNPQSAMDDPCNVTPQTVPYPGGGAGGGIAVSDAITEINTGGILDQTAAIQENTSVIAQLEYQHCEAEQAARRADMQNATDSAPAAWQDTGPDTQAPGAQ